MAFLQKFIILKHATQIWSQTNDQSWQYYYYTKRKTIACLIAYAIDRTHLDIKLSNVEQKLNI